MHSFDGRIGVIAGRQRGLITIWQLRRCGLSPSAVTRRVHSERLVRVERGVYSVMGPVIDDTTRRLAVVLACPPGSALGGIAALQARSFTRFTTPRATIEVPQQCRLPFTEAEVHITSAARAGHVRTVHASKVTSMPWTIARLGADLNAAQLCHVIHESCWRHIIRESDVERLLDAHPTWRGHGVVQAALRERRAESAGTKSFLEDRFVGIYERVAGYTPRVNVHVDLGVQSVEVDIPLLDRKLLIEVDGPPHDDPLQQAKDRSRDSLAAACGLRTERFHWRLIQHRAEECAARLHAVLFG